MILGSACQMSALPLYALPAYRECGPGTYYESDGGLVIEPMLSHPNIQDYVPRDCFLEHDETVTEVQDEGNAKVTTLCMQKDLVMCVPDAVPRDCVNERVKAMTGTQVWSKK